MMRPFTCLALVAALGAGLYLYQEKHRATLLDRDITRTVKQTDQVRERIRTLNAEWALLNDTQRLADLVAHHLPQLQQLQPAQYVRLDDLRTRLPEPSAVPVTPGMLDDAPAAPAPAAAEPAVAVVTPARPAQLSAARIAAKPRLLAAAKPRERDAEPVTMAQASSLPVYAPPPAPILQPPVLQPPAPASRPSFAPVLPAYAPAPVVIHAPTVQTASATAPETPFVGSALGMSRRFLAAPVPVTSAAQVGYVQGR